MTNILSIDAIADKLDTSAPTVEMMDLGDLIVDPQVQRALSGTRVGKIANQFNPLGLGVLTVNRRTSEDENPTYHVVDGQHRKAAANLVGFTDKVLCRVFHGLTLEQEASLFLLLNNTQRTGPQDTWNMRVMAGDPQALGQKALLTQYGWKVSSNSAGRGNFTAVSALDRVWRKSPDLAYLTIRTLDHAFGKNPKGMQKVLIQALAAVYDRYNGMVNPNAGARGSAFLKVNEDTMASRLGGFDGGAVGLLTAARAQKDILSMRVVDTAAMLMVNAYNYGKQGNRLPAWEASNAKLNPGENASSLTSLDD